MKGRAFLNSISNSDEDFLQIFLNVLDEHKVDFCAVNGLAVNAYAEPVVSLDLDVVVVADRIGEIREDLGRLFKIKEHPHSINVTSSKSDLRIQVQTDPRYQDFILRAQIKEVLGYQMPVAAIEDVLQGKIWAYRDQTRRASKRQKDLADILRLVEAHPELKAKLPADIHLGNF